MLNVTGYLPFEIYLMVLPVPIALTVVQIVYALVIYPSFFGAEPKAKSSFAISLLNFFFGGPLFGALWNHNITKRSKGISNVVIAVLLIIDLAYSLYLLVVVFSLL